MVSGQLYWFGRPIEKEVKMLKLHMMTTLDWKDNRKKRSRSM